MIEHYNNSTIREDLSYFVLYKSFDKQLNKQFLWQCVSKSVGGWVGG